MRFNSSKSCLLAKLTFVQYIRRTSGHWQFTIDDDDMCVDNDFHVLGRWRYSAWSAKQPLADVTSFNDKAERWKSDGNDWSTRGQSTCHSRISFRHSLKGERNCSRRRTDKWWSLVNLRVSQQLSMIYYIDKFKETTQPRAECNFYYSPCLKLLPYCGIQRNVYFSRPTSWNRLQFCCWAVLYF